MYGKDASSENLKDVKMHYLRMDLSGTEDHTLTVSIVGHTSQTAILLDNCYKYNKPTQFGKSTKIMSDFEFDKIEELFQTLDIENRYKYNHEVSEITGIADPVAAQSFNNVNHIYNPYTICEFSTAYIS